MFGGKKTSDLGGGTVTIIGAGVSVKGNVAFSGYLRVEGSIVGNVTCNSEPRGTIVVHGPGSVTGSIRAPNIVIGGCVAGDLHAAESIEIHPEASVVGDVYYKRLAIQSGGTFDGGLFPMAIEAAEMAEATQTPAQERRVALPDTPDIKALDGPHAHERRATDRFRTSHKLAIGAAILLALAFLLWPNRMRTETTPAPVTEAPLQATLDMAPVPEKPAEPPVVAAPAASQPDTEAAVPASTPTTPTTSAEPAEPEERPAPDPDRILTVEGVELRKPTKLFFVSTREPVVLYQKLRSDTGEGKRIEVGRRVKKRFPISEQEVIRVAKGSDLDMYYQGGKVPTRIVQSGAWINFVPLVAPDKDAAN